ncbi:cadherin-like beta sandwich domain-containing protein [Paenibacillus contaminans]|uniref:cadherin-like beta sandwich domain-containing protein n=1 Tax=Paenibacillus contaminans TaxID=450362 RepID=UPI0013142558|nr:cadherin-like beta sandwich domain-containing protein [Paenibacillus contaminans]
MNALYQARMMAKWKWKRKTALLLSLLLVLELMISIFAPGAMNVGTAEAADEPAPKYTTFLYKDFAKAASRIKFNNAAQVMPDGRLRLTPSVGATGGSIFNKERISLSASKAFSTYFAFQFSEQVNAGADGLVFVLQAGTNTAGSPGGDLGYLGIDDSLGIEFDSYYNPSDLGDPSTSHVGIHMDGTVNHKKLNKDGSAKKVVDVLPLGFNFDRTDKFHVWIDYDGQKISVFMNKNSNTRPADPILTQENVDLSRILTSEDVYAGFTAATGGAYENHDILEWYFTNKFDPIDDSCGCYREAPAVLDARTTVVNSVYRPGDTAYFTEVRLSDSSDNPGSGIALQVSNTSNITFLDASNQLAAYPGAAPTVTTDTYGIASYYFIPSTQGASPKFRVSTEFGTYEDVKIGQFPQVATGNVTPIYTSAGAKMEADIVANIQNTGNDSIIGWGVEYRKKAEGDAPAGPWITQRVEPYVIDTAGPRTVRLKGLEEDTFYEARAFAKNSGGASYGDIKTFIVQVPMQPGDVAYDNIGPGHLFVEDEQAVTLIGRNLNYLLKKMPVTDLAITVNGNGQTYPIPRESLKLVSSSNLKIELPKQADGSPLALGAYDLTINHTFFPSKTFNGAFRITDDASYRSRNYDEIVVRNNSEVRGPNEVDSITLRGPFIEYSSQKDVYQLKDPNAIVTLNDNLLFKGTSLIVDKTDPDKETIKGNGRLYINGKGVVPVMTTYTVFEGEFEFNPDNFSFQLRNPLNALDYIGMNMPVVIKSFTFIKGGIRVSGDMEVKVGVGSVEIKGGAKIDALEFKQNRIDLDADFKIGADFKSGPLESSELRFGIDTRIPEFRAGASAELKKAKIGFDIDLTIKKARLDAISFAVKKQMKLGSTGAQLTKIGGGVSNMSSMRTAPLTFSVLGAMSDYVTPKLSGNYMLNANDLRIDLSANHFGASGSLAIYSIKAADLESLIVYNPTGYQGFNKAGFRMGAKVNILDVIIGEVLVKYFQGQSFTGYAKAAIQIPRNITLIGGSRLASAEVGVYEKDMRAGLSVIGIGFKLAYIFSTKKTDFDVDVASTVKNVGKAVVNTGKAIVSGVKKIFSLFGTETSTKKGVMILSLDAGNGKAEKPEMIGQKLFESERLKATARGFMVPGKLTTHLLDTNPFVSKSGSLVRQTFKVDKPYQALLVLRHANQDVRLLKPDGTQAELRFNTNAAYNAEAGTVIAELDLNYAGEWTLESDDTLSVEIHKVLYRNPDLSISDVAGQVQTAERKAYVPLTFNERGTYLVEMDGAVAEAELLKADGRPYAVEASEQEAAWNTYSDGDKLYILAEISETGTWLANAGASAKVSLYKIQPGVGMSKVKAWKEAPEFASMADFNGISGMQVLLEIGSASAETKLYKPDGTIYPLVTDSSAAGWNAVFDESRGVITALVDVDFGGMWFVKSDDFTNLSALVLDQATSMAELNAEGVTYEYTLIMNEGRFLFDIAGGDASTQILDDAGNAVPIIYDENRPDRNAILDTEGRSLKVTVNVPRAGSWKIKTAGAVTIDQYKVNPVPEVNVLQAAAQSAMNSYEVTWRVNNPKPDTKVSLIMTENPEEPVGQVIASDLPASGIKTVTLPDGNLPGSYYLAVVADSEAFGPIFKVMDSAVELKAESMLQTPADLQAVSTGNGEITLRFQDSESSNVTAYRVLLADESGKVSYNGKVFDVEPKQGETQEAILSGLQTNETYHLSVMALHQSETSGLVSAPSSAVTVYLPDPEPVSLSLELNTHGQAYVEHLYDPYYVKAEDLEGLTVQERELLKDKLTVTDANRVTVEIGSDQAAKVELFVNGESVGIKEAAAQQAVSFELSDLSERDYTISAEAVNERGDRSFFEQKMVVDRTAPYLYLKSPINGEVLGDSRVKLEGASGPGVRLTVNGAAVPVDRNGKFEYYTQIPSNGKLPLVLVAKDEVGNTTEHRLEVLKGAEAGNSGSAVDLAALAVDEGVLTSSFTAEGQDYYTTIDSRVKKLRVWAVPFASNAIVTVNGTVVDAARSALIDVMDGTTVTAVVKAGGNEKTYRLHVRTESDLAALKGLKVSGLPEEASEAADLSLNAPFNSTRTDYEMNVPNGITAVSLTPEAVADGSLIRVNGEETASRRASTELPLNVGDNALTVQVISPDEARKPEEQRDWTKAATYTVNIAREASGNAYLQSLGLEDVQLTPGTFDKDVFEYQATVTSDVTAVSLNASSADSEAAMLLNGEPLEASGKPVLELAPGANKFEIKVKAQNGDEQTYKLTVYRQQPFAFELSLSDLSLNNEMVFTQPFSPWVRNYNSRSLTYARLVTVYAVPSVTGTFVTINGKPIDDKNSAVVDLQPGSNTVLVRLESTDRSESNVYAIGITRLIDDTPNSSPNTSTTTTIPSFSISVNKDTNRTAAVATKTTDNGSSILHVAFVPEQLEKALDGQARGTVITIAIEESYDKIVSELTASLLRKMQEKEAVLVIRTGKGNYTLPATAINMKQVDETFGANATQDAIKVLVQLTPSSETVLQAIESSAASAGAEIAGTPVDFDVTFTYKDRSMNVGRFEQYVARELPLPDGIDPKRITTGVRYQEDGSLQHVPTYITQSEGKYWAVINSLTNSTYALIAHSKTFDDIQGHWAQTSIEDLASRLVLNGKSDDRYEPDDKVTRAEFTAIVIRSLGLAPEKAASAYGDVQADDWFAPFVATAQAYGLISGYEDGTFRPDRTISRAEATVFLSKAWALAGGASLTEEEAAAALSGVSDSADIPAWAKTPVGSAVKLGLLQGYEDGSVQTQRSITRAETATLVRNLLLKSELIQP